MLRFSVLIALAILTMPVRVAAQSSPGPLAPTPAMSDLDLVNRQRQAFEQAGVGVGRIYLRFDGSEVTSLFEKKHPQFINWFAASNNAAWDRRARKMKPVTTPAEPGRLVIRSRWNSSAFNRNATCDFDDFAPGFYEVFLLNASSTSEAVDMSKDNFICSVHLLPLNQKVLDAWVNGVAPDKHSLVRECADASGNVAGPQFWQCIHENGIAMPALDKEMLSEL